MRKTLIFAAAGTAAAWLVADAVVSNEIALDTRTLGAGGTATEAPVDTRGLTIDVSDDIRLNTRKIFGTLFFLR
jgi:hypothetical protein